MHTIKCFQILLFNTNNSIKHQSLAYTQLNDQTVLFLAIQFSISHLFALSLIVEVHSLNVKQLYFIHREGTLSGVTSPGQSEPGSDGKKEVLCIPPKLQHYWDTHWEVLPLCRDAIFYSPSQQGHQNRSFIISVVYCHKEIIIFAKWWGLGLTLYWGYSQCILSPSNWDKLHRWFLYHGEGLRRDS